MRASAARERERGPGDRRERARGTNAHLPQGSASDRGKTNKSTHPRRHKNQYRMYNSRVRNLPEAQSYVLELANKIGRCLWIRGMDTVTRGVTTGVGTPRNHTLDGSTAAQKLADARLDFGPRPTEAHAAGLDEPVGVRSPRVGSVVKVQADRGRRDTTVQQTCPGGKVR